MYLQLHSGLITVWKFEETRPSIYTEIKKKKEEIHDNVFIS